MKSLTQRIEDRIPKYASDEQGQLDILVNENVQFRADIARLARSYGRVETALRELLEYTGGSDLVETQPSHPIAKAYRALNSTK